VNDTVNDTVNYTVFDTPLGVCALSWSTQGLRRLLLPEKSRAALERRMRELEPHATAGTPDATVRRALTAVARHLGGKPARFEGLPLDLEAVTSFRRRVFQTLRDLPRGHTIGYGELATRVGRPGGARAVGQAMAHNPLPVIIPCHRVLAAGGKLGGFTAYGGVTTKATLLGLEGVSTADQPLFDGAAALPFDAAKATRLLRRADPPLAKLMRRVGPLRLRLKQPRSTFAALSEAIVYQQLTGKAAATIYARLLATFPRRRQLQPSDVADCDADRLRAAGLSRAKTAALQDLARKAVSGELPSLTRLRRMDDDAIVAALTNVRGVGRWTAEMLLMFQLGRPDVLPVGDLGIRKGFAKTYDLADLPEPSALLDHGERWRPYRSVASWYLWRALELD
jgi:methylated-DNA-[protein]-cysteine S-methyltransferase